MLDDETKRVSILLALSGLGGMIVGVVRGVIQDKHQGAAGWFRGALASMFVGVLVGTGIDGTVTSVPVKFCVVSLACFVADDVLTAIATLSRLASNDPLGFLSRFRRAWTGNKDEGPTK